jgi:diadenosine tetraphosphate (Ap4A) HIT family hydrolase
MAAGCLFCEEAGGEIIFANQLLRVVWINDEDYPGFCRVIVHEHVAEMMDLPALDQQKLMQVVLSIAHTQRVHLNPDKINLASLGNVVPHLHWHVIPRWKTDACFPNSVWSPKQRDGVVPVSTEQVEVFRQALIEQLQRTADQA